MALVPHFKTWLRTLGAPEDPVATDTSSEWSAMSLLKAIYAALANGTFVASITSVAESSAAQATRAALMAANYMKLARTSKISAAADALSAAGNAIVAKDAANLVAGNAMLGQRVKKDRVAAAASAAAAAASAASVPSAEALILPNQIFS